MRTFAINRHLGLDTRPGQYGEDRPTLVTASNCSVLTGGALRRRPAMVKDLDLHAESCGLYVRGGRLRSVVPGGRSIQDSQPANVVYDPIGEGVAYPLGVLSRLVGADTFGTDTIFGPHGYVAVKRTSGLIEHHWVKRPPAATATAVTTRISLPYAPGESLVKLEGRVWAPAPAEGTVRHCSILGPDNWTATGDAGFLPVLTHLSGAHEVLTLNHFRSRLAVFFRDAVQLWHVDEDVDSVFLEQVVNGPGALLAGAVANVQGDVVYLSRGGFRTLSTASVTGQADAGDVGSSIKSLTDAIGTATPAVALWSESRQQFICCIGTTAYVWTYIPSEKLAAWTTWTLPVTIDYLVENDGVLSARSGTGLYHFVDGGATDPSSAAITATVETRPLALGAPGRTKTLHYLVIRQTTAATWQVIVDGVALRARSLPACSPKSIRVPLAGEGRQVALKITATADWRLEGLAIEYEEQGL